MLKRLQPPVETTVGEHEFRDAMRLFASGVTIISTSGPAGDIHGMTATAFSSLSLRPPLVLVAVAHNTRCHRRVTAARRFGVSILHSHQTDLSRHFGGKPIAGPPPKFTTLDDVPVLDDAMVTLSCNLDETLEGGDHTIFIGLVTATQVSCGEPLIHFGGAYRTLSKDKA
jgi:flavin reductase (DIM6/NTAB) family NADH-FMN oxidoreductase RutF